MFTIAPRVSRSCGAAACDEEERRAQVGAHEVVPLALRRWRRTAWRRTTRRCSPARRGGRTRAAASSTRRGSARDVEEVGLHDGARARARARSARRASALGLGARAVAVQHDARARGVQRARDRGADAPRRAGDEDRAILHAIFRRIREDTKRECSRSAHDAPQRRPHPAAAVARSRRRIRAALAEHIAGDDRRRGRLDPVLALHGARALRAGPGLLHRGLAQVRRARATSSPRPRSRRCSRKCLALQARAGARRRSAATSSSWGPARARSPPTSSRELKAHGQAARALPAARGEPRPARAPARAASPQRFPGRHRPLRVDRRAAGEDPRHRDRQRGARRRALRARASRRAARSSSAA